MNQKILWSGIFLLLCWTPTQAETFSRRINWLEPVESSVPGMKAKKVLHFEGAGFDGSLPIYFERFPLPGSPSSVDAILVDPVYEAVMQKELLTETIR
jgi:hypothetical protein